MKASERAAEIQRVIAILHKWGIHSLGQFAALRKEDVSARLGTEAVRMWERATGQTKRLLKLVSPPEEFIETFEFEHEIETIEPLLFMLRRFLEQLTLRLGAHYFVARELLLHLTFSDKNSYQHQFKIPQPSNEVETLFRMLHTHLENFASAAPIVAVTLSAQPAKPGRQQFSLFESALRDPARLSETLARLVGLLGTERVGTPVLEDSYRPDAFRMEAFSWELPPPPNELSSLATSPPLAQTAALALRRFRSEEKINARIIERAGPFRSSGNWWDENHWARAEWDLALEGGALCRAHEAEEQWQLDGVYD